MISFLKLTVLEKNHRNSTTFTANFMFILLQIVGLDVSFFVRATDIGALVKNLTFNKLDTSPSTLESETVFYCMASENCCKHMCNNSVSDENLIFYLEAQYKICDGPMELVLYDVIFKDNIIKKTDLNGKFRLHSLRIAVGVIDSFDDNAFNKASLHDLEILQILSARVDSINEKTFAGLVKLKKFEMVNNIKGFGQLTAAGMLKPMESSLTEINFQHKSAKLYGFDPGDWLQGANLTSLRKVFLNSNYFTNKLNKNSFVRLQCVETLTIQACCINFLPHDTFDSIVSTLKYLDLSHNELKTLNPNLLYDAAKKNIQLNIEDNRWDCICQNAEFIEATRNERLNLTSPPQCKTPLNLKCVEMANLKLCCPPTDGGCMSGHLPIEIDTTKLATNEISDENYTATTQINEETFTRINLSCRNPLSQKPLIIVIKDQLVFFTVTTTSTGSVLIKLGGLKDGASILYFMENNIINFRYKTFNGYKMYVSDLETDHSYVFCIMPLLNDFISPFNCRSHHMVVTRLNDSTQLWLSCAIKPLFITLVTISTTLCAFIGIITTYWILRWRPTILVPHKQLEKLNSITNQVLLKKSSAQFSTEDTNNVLRSCGEHDTNDHANYKSNFKLYKRKVVTSNLYECSPPHHRAPALPPTVCKMRTISLQSSMFAADVDIFDSINENLRENDYQSLEDYQHFYEAYNADQETSI